MRVWDIMWMMMWVVHGGVAEIMRMLNMVMMEMSLLLCVWLHWADHLFNSLVGRMAHVDVMYTPWHSVLVCPWPRTTPSSCLVLCAWCLRPALLLWFITQDVVCAPWSVALQIKIINLIKYDNVRSSCGCCCLAASLYHYLTAEIRSDMKKLTGKWDCSSYLCLSRPEYP